MAATRPSETERKNWIGDPGRRRSMRVLLSVPIRVKGKDASGKAFEEEARTLVVNAHGALISLKTPVIAGQELALSNLATQKSVLCKIVYLGAQQAGRVQMGIEFEAPTPSFWQIDFPPEDWIVPEN